MLSTIYEALGNEKQDTSLQPCANENCETTSVPLGQSIKALFPQIQGPEKTLAKHVQIFKGKFRNYSTDGVMYSLYHYTVWSERQIKHCEGQ